MPTRAAPASRGIIYGLFLLSGCAGLIYELVWTRELIFVFGGTTYAITTILVSFMAGLGLGSYVAGRLSHRLRQAGRVYGCLEVAIGAYALAVPFLLGVAEPLYRFLYARAADAPWVLTAARFCIGSLIVLVPTTFMGATLPILVRYVTGIEEGFGRSVGLLYGINTFGAMLGTMAAGFWLIPTFGLTRTTWIAACLNLLVGTAAIVLLRLPTPAKAAGGAEKPAPPRSRAAPAPVVTPRMRKWILGAFAASGFAAMVYQIMWTRVLVMALGSSTYSFTCILAAFILGLAAGSLVIARWVDRIRQPVTVFGALEIAIGLTAALIVPIYGHVPSIVYRIVTGYSGDYSTLIRVEFLLIIAITFVPTFLMGAVFPLVTRLIAVGGNDPGAATGQAYAVNTVGTITGSFLAGFVMIRSEVLGVQNSIVAAALLNGIVGASLVIASRPAGAALVRRAAACAIFVLAIPAIPAGAGKWDREVLTSAPFLGRRDPQTFKQQEKVIFFAEGPDLTAAVYQPIGAKDVLMLSVNGKTDASTTPVDMVSMLLCGHIPALLVDEGRSACIVGLGSGLTLGAMTRYDSYERIDCIEISDEVIKAANYFSPYIYDVLTADPRVRIIRADGRNHLLLTDRKYDLIVSQPPNPWVAGVSNLFTKEYFALCRNRLNADGRFCAWMHSYFSSLDDFRMVVRTLCEVFDYVSVWCMAENDYLFVASARPNPVPLDRVLTRFSAPGVRAELYRISMLHPGQVLGRFITAGPTLRDWAAGAPVHTDDNALLEFSAPRAIFRNEALLTAEELAGLQKPPFDELIVASSSDPRHEAVRDQAASVARSRKLLAEAWELGRQRQFAASLEKFIQAFECEPNNGFLYKTLIDREPLLREVDPRLAASPELKAMFARIAALRPPVVSTSVPATLPEIAGKLESLALQAAGQQRWEWAAGYMNEAASFSPGNGDAIAMSSYFLLRAGRPDEALSQIDALLKEQPRHGRGNFVRAQIAVYRKDFDTAVRCLDAAFDAKVVTPAQVGADPNFQALREDARFKALLDRYGQSGAASAPA